MENAEETVVFDEEFRLDHIRWVVRAHVALALTATAFFLCFTEAPVAGMAWISVAIAQWALLLVWLTLCGEKSLRRMFAVAAYADLMFIVHEAPFSNPSEIPGLVGGVIGFVFYGEILSLPLRFAREKGLRVKRMVSGRMPASAPLQFNMSRLLWMTALAAILFGAAQTGRRGTGGASAENAIGVVVVFVVGAAMFLTWTRACVWIAMTPGQVMPRLAVAVYQWLVGTLLMVRDLTPASLDMLWAMGVWGIATAILLVTLVLVRRVGYYAIWETEKAGGESNLVDSLD